MANNDDDDRPIELPILKKSDKRRPDRQEAGSSLQHHQSGPRDPRFDPKVAGSGDPRHFIRNYSFLDEVRHTELGELQKAVKKEKDPEKKDKIRMTITRYRNKIIDRRQKEQFNAKKKLNSKEKKLQLLDKFRDLKETGKLTKYLERKRKKLLKRDQKSFAS